MNVKITVPVFLIAMLLISACEDKGNPIVVVAPTDTLTHFSQIQSLIATYNCASCHPGNGGFSVSSYSTITGTGDHGAILIPGNGDGSNIVKKLRGTAAFGVRMPQGGPYLSTTEIQKFVNWINQGALNN